VNVTPGLTLVVVLPYSPTFPADALSFVAVPGNCPTVPTPGGLENPDIDGPQM
jgi:hypothetical protein